MWINGSKMLNISSINAMVPHSTGVDSSTGLVYTHTSCTIPDTSLIHSCMRRRDHKLLSYRVSTMIFMENKCFETQWYTVLKS